MIVAIGYLAVKVVFQVANSPPSGCSKILLEVISPFGGIASFGLIIAKMGYPVCSSSVKINR